MPSADPQRERFSRQLPPGRRRPPGLLGDDSGVIYVEYIVLVLMVGVIVAAAILSLGVPLLESFRMTQSFLGAPIP